MSDSLVPEVAIDRMLVRLTWRMCDCGLRHATLIAPSMHVSYGLEDDLVYVAASKPENVSARVRTDPNLRRLIAAVLNTCLQRAKDLIATHSEFLDEVTRILAECGSIDAREIEPILTGQLA